MMRSRQKLQYFDIYEHDQRFALCMLFNNKISCGGEKKKATTTSMKNQLETRHPVTAVPSASVSKKNIKIDLRLILANT